MGCVGVAPTPRDFQSRASTELAYIPYREATARFELAVLILQTTALPLGYVAILRYTDSNRDYKGQNLMDYPLSDTVLTAPDGVEPSLSESESGVLPINESAIFILLLQCH